jgi:methylated-DNA-[protein]-cysteine S-methyltransferase
MQKRDEGGFGSMYTRHAIAGTDLGELTLAAADDAVTGIYFPHHWVTPAAGSLGERVEIEGDPLLESARSQLAQYLAGDRDSFDLPTATQGDPFEEQVWAMLREIPFGETTTYGALAERLGDKALARTVGRAVGHNPLSIIVACHRVVGKDGKLTGYAGGLERKQFLLELEGSAPVEAPSLF